MTYVVYCPKLPYPRFQTVDMALLAAERLSRNPLPGTVGQYYEYSIWAEENRVQLLRAIAYKGVAHWVKASNTDPRGYEETGQDRG